MAKLTTLGHFGFIEYPPCDNPEFEINKDGFLFVFGYSTLFWEKHVRMAKQFKFDLLDYRIVGKFNDVRNNLADVGISDEFYRNQNIDTDNCLVVIKKDLDN